MHGDEPTVPNLRMYGAEDPTETPNWPLASRRLPPPSSPNTDLRTALLGASLGANVVLLVGLIGVLLLARAGFFSPASSLPQSSPAASSNQPQATPSPTQSTPSPTAISNWLQVAPTAVSLGCESGQQTQYVVLANQGPEQVEWQANFSVPQDQAGVSISPDHGTLRAGASIALRLQNRSHDNGQQGAISFEVSSQDAGSPPSLSYTMQACD